MNAIQYVGEYPTKEEADTAFSMMAEIDGFLGGRVYPRFSKFCSQAFFPVDSPLAELDGFRKVIIPDGQKLNLVVK